MDPSGCKEVRAGPTKAQMQTGAETDCVSSDDPFRPEKTGSLKVSSAQESGMDPVELLTALNASKSTSTQGPPMKGRGVAWSALHD